LYHQYINKIVKKLEAQWAEPVSLTSWANQYKNCLWQPCL